MPQDKNEKEEDDALRRFIDRLENWPEDMPPTPAELRALRSEIRLTQEDRDKLEILSENHIRRARSSLAGGAYDQAAAELARAAQLRPLDSRPKTELAGIYLQRSLERGYGRNDRNKALRLARKALELNPGDQEARRFLQEYRRMNADFRSAKYRKYIVPGIVTLAILISLAVWKRDWVVNLVRPAVTVTEGGVPEQAVTAEPGKPRPVNVELQGLSDGDLNTEILSASVGSRNDASFVDIRGRIRSDSAVLGPLKLLVRGRDALGKALFAIPVTVRDVNSPLLRPGDSQPLTMFRWLAESDSLVDHLELTPYEMQLIENPAPFVPTKPELVWDTLRPEGAGLEAELRNMQVFEAFDRQVLLMDLAMRNTGVSDLSALSLNISLGSEWAGISHRAVGTDEPSLARGERRVWSMAMGFPLDADLTNRPVTIRITEANR